MRNVTTKVRRIQEWLRLLVKRRKRSAMAWPCERWSSRLKEDWAAKAPSCCVIWWQRRRQTDSAARMLSDDGGPTWNECCRLHKQTHACERWDPESQRDLLLSLLCCWQSRVCIVFVCVEVLALRLSCEGSFDRDRDRHTQTQRQRHRETDTHRHTQTHTDTHRHPGTQRHTQTHRDRDTRRHTHRHTQTHPTNRHTNLPTY